MVSVPFLFGSIYLIPERYDPVRKIVQEAASIPGGDHSSETKISQDSVLNMPQYQCITVPTSKRIKVGIAKLGNSGIKTNGDEMVITPNALWTRIDDPVTNAPTTKENFIVPASFLSSRKIKKVQQQLLLRSLYEVVSQLPSFCHGYCFLWTIYGSLSWLCMSLPSSMQEKETNLCLVM